MVFYSRNSGVANAEANSTSKVTGKLSWSLSTIVSRY